MALSFWGGGWGKSRNSELKAVKVNLNLIKRMCGLEGGGGGGGCLCI